MSTPNSTGAANSSATPAPAESSAENTQTESTDSSEGSEETLDASDDGEDSSDDVEASSEEKAKEDKKVDALKKKLKLKVKGKEIEEEIDFNDDERLTRALQKEKAFDIASQELADMKKQFSGLIQQLKGEQVLDLLRDLGHDVDGLAEKHLQQLVDEAKKSPEQIEREKMEKELKSLKEEKERLAKEKEEKEIESIRNQMAAEIESDIQDTLQKVDTILPKKNPKVIRAIAQNMLFAMKNGYPEVTAQDVIPLVEREYRNDLKEIMDVLPEETIEALVGKNNLDRVRKKRLASKKVKTQTAQQVVKETGIVREDDSNDSSAKKSYRDFFNT